MKQIQSITLRSGITIGTGHPCFIVAEIGNNHQGEVDRARHLVDLAASAGADLVKFQLRDLASLYRGSGDLTAYPLLVGLARRRSVHRPQFVRSHLRRAPQRLGIVH